MFRPTLTRRDTLILLLGATLMHILSVIFSSSEGGNIIINTHSGSHLEFEDVSQGRGVAWDAPLNGGVKTVTVTVAAQSTSKAKVEAPVGAGDDVGDDDEGIPTTAILHHAPGWTLFRNLYMSRGTLFIVSPDGAPQGWHESENGDQHVRWFTAQHDGKGTRPDGKEGRPWTDAWPARRMMISPGIPAENTPENIKAREPTDKDMVWVTTADARKRWGERIRVIEGNTVLVNEPTQFLRHYYHLVAELFFGVQSFWWGAFNSVSGASLSKDTAKNSHSSSHSKSKSGTVDITRVIFANSNADGWRDGPGFNAYFMRAAFPSITTEVMEDWGDRVIHSASEEGKDKVFRFPLVLLTDRSASHRGEACGSRTQRIASEAHEYMGLKKHAGKWWEDVRQQVLGFAGVETQTGSGLSVQMPGGTRSRGTADDKVVITYVTRQGVSRRKLTPESHESLVTALQALVDKKNREYEDGFEGVGGGGRVNTNANKKRKRWELTVMAAETLTKDAQIAQAARTTVMLGVHGNGLSHLLWMPQSTTASSDATTRTTTDGQRAVIELFYPGGFAQDYHWTSRALGHAHYAFWNDTFYSDATIRGYDTKPELSVAKKGGEKLGVDYPEGFQENYIPSWGPAVAEVVERHIEGMGR